jgi:hypothetical protein
MRFLPAIIFLLIGCQRSETGAVGQQPAEEDTGEIGSAPSGDDVDPGWLREQVILTLPWTISSGNFGCKFYETVHEIGVLGDTTKFFMLVSVRTLSPGTQQLRFSTYEKDGTWLTENNRLEFCVLLVDADENMDDEGACAVKLNSTYSITVTDDLKLHYSETQVRSSCEKITKDTYNGTGAIVEGIVTGFSIKTSTEEDTTDVVN